MASKIVFTCDFCDKSLSTKQNLKVHYVSQHKHIPESFKSIKETFDLKKCPNCSEQITSNNFARHFNKCTKFQNARSSTQNDDKECDPYFWNDTREHFKFFLKNRGIVGSLYEYMTHFDQWTAFKSGKFATEAVDIVAAVDFFQDYVITITSQTQRHRATCMYAQVIAFCDEYYETDFGKLVPFSEDFYIALYMDAPERKQALTDLNFEFFHGDINQIRSFLMTEMILSTRDLDFVKQITTASFQTAEEQDAAGNLKIRFNEKEYKIYKNLKNLIGSFISIANPPNKLFGSGKFKQVEKLPKSVEGCIERMVRSLRPIKLQKIMELQFEYTE